MTSRPFSYQLSSKCAGTVSSVTKLSTKMQISGSKWPRKNSILSLGSEVGHNLQLQQSLSTSVAVDLAGPSMCDLMTQWVEWNFRYMLSTSNIHVHTFLLHKLKKLPRCLPRWPRWMSKGFFDALLLLAGWIELSSWSFFHFNLWRLALCFHFSENYEIAVVCASYVALWHQHKGGCCGVAGPGHVTTSIDLDLSFATRSTNAQIRKFINRQMHKHTRAGHLSFETSTSNTDILKYTNTQVQIIWRQSGP